MNQVVKKILTETVKPDSSEHRINTHNHNSKANNACSSSFDFMIDPCFYTNENQKNTTKEDYCTKDYDMKIEEENFIVSDGSNKKSKI